MNLYTMKRKELDSSSGAAEPHSLPKTTHKSSVKALDPPRSRHQGNKDRPIKKHEVLVSFTDVLFW